MFKKYPVKSYFGYSILAAVLFCITVLIFLINGDYVSTWWLFVGNGLFMLSIFYFMWSFNKTKSENASASSLVISGHLTTILAIIISSIVSYILMIMFVPGLFQSGEVETAIEGAPPSIDTGKTDGLMFMVFMCATIGNISAGSFASLVFAYTAKRDQTEESAEIKFKVPK